MVIKDLFIEQKHNFDTAFPNIAYSDELILERLKRKQSNYTGTGKLRIEVLPDITDDSKVWLKLCSKVYEALKDLITQRDIEEIDDCVFKDINLNVNDIERLLVLPSASLEPTIGDPELLVSNELSEKFYNMLIRYYRILSELSSSLRFDCFTKKKKNSSSGSFIGSGSTEFTAAMYSDFYGRMAMSKNPIKFINDYVDSLREVMTLPITRRMIKRPKPYSDYTVTGKKEMTRQLSNDERSRVNNLKDPSDKKLNKYIDSLVTSKHRFINLNHESERILNPFYVVCEHNKANHIIFRKYNEQRLLDRLKCVSEAIQINMSDNVAMDKNINDFVVCCFEQYISNLFVNPSGNKNVIESLLEEPGFLTRLRFKKKLLFPQNGKLVNFEEAVEAYKSTNPKITPYTAYRSKFDNKYKYFTKGDDSGWAGVAEMAKDARLISELVIIDTIKPLSDSDITAFLAGQLCYNSKSDEYYYDMSDDWSANNDRLSYFNIGDDVCCIYPPSFGKQYRNLAKKGASDEVGRNNWLPFELDKEFLSKQIVLSEGKFHLVPNYVRRVVSFLKPEYSIKSSEGLYKDLKLSLESKKLEFKSSQFGEEIFKLLDDCWTQVFGASVEATIDDLEGTYVKNSINLELHNFVGLTKEELEFIDNPDKLYYKFLNNEVRKDVVELFFYHFDNSFLEIFRR